MTYEVAQDTINLSEWRVEAINYDGDGEVFVTIFSGPRAEERAKEYADWKNEAVSSALRKAS